MLRDPEAVVKPLRPRVRICQIAYLQILTNPTDARRILRPRSGNGREPLVFVTTDRGLATAAAAEKLAVFDPLYQRAETLAEMFG